MIDYSRGASKIVLVHFHVVVFPKAHKTLLSFNLNHCNIDLYVLRKKKIRSPSRKVNLKYKYNLHSRKKIKPE